MSLRRTALIWMTILLTVVGAVGVIIAYRFESNEASELLDGQQRQIAFNAGEGLHRDLTPLVDRDPEDEFSVTIWDATGHVIHESMPEARIPRQSRQGFADVVLDGQGWRVYLATDGNKTVQVAQRAAVRDELARDAALGIAAPLLLVIPLSWIVVGWAMKRMFAKLDALAGELLERGANADNPIPTKGIPSEIAPLVRGMNSLIARLRGAVERQQQFLADAAHELRTPLAAIQIQADALSSGSTDAIADRAAAITDGVRRASASVNQLLRLARLGEATPAIKERFEIAPLLLECVADYVERSDRNGVDLGVTNQASATLNGSPAEIRVLLDNLIDNAVRYTPRGGTVDISSRAQDGQAVIEIVDSGPGIPPGKEELIFDRFFRAAPSDVEGTGLGLAIGRRIAERHGATLTIRNRGDGQSGARARLELPCVVEWRAN